MKMASSKTSIDFIQPREYKSRILQVCKVFIPPVIENQPGREEGGLKKDRNGLPILSIELLLS